MLTKIKKVDVCGKTSRSFFGGRNDFRVSVAIQPGTRGGQAKNFLVRRAGREEWCAVKLAAVVISDFPRFPREKEPKMTFGPDHFFGAFARCVEWRLW